MSLPAGSVVAASNSWTWIPDYATTAETDEYLLIRFPDYFDHPLELVRFTPSGPAADGVATVLGRAREFGVPAVHWMIRMGTPAEVATLLEAAGATVEETLDVLAADLAGGPPDLPGPAAHVELRWDTETQTQRDGSAVGVAVFGGAMPPEDRLAANSQQNSASFQAGEGGFLVAYLDGEPAGCGGVAIVNGVARLWGGGVVEGARGQGVYRAILTFITLVRTCRST